MSKIRLPVTRYYGSKRKLVERIWNEIERKELIFDSVLDIFGGTGLFSYYAKCKSKQVIYNDIFRFNSIIGKKLIQQSSNELTLERARNMLLPIEGVIYRNVITENFTGIYFTDEENHQIDIFIQNINFLENENLQASAYYILFQSCIIKRPYNLFHRNNLNMRLNYKKGNFGNKKTWERSFSELFERFINELDEFCFDNGEENISLNSSALQCNAQANLLYIDPPYFTSGSNTTYHSKYHFLEGLAHYDEIQKNIDHNKKNKEITINKSLEFESKTTFLNDLQQLLLNHTDSHIVISYRNNGVPSIEDMAELLRSINNNFEVSVIDLGNYGYALNRNNINNNEVLIIAKNILL
ncbi:uncharacterized protein CHSO_1456 [Chryseobacterium sp. StRB126]|uniref:DNA adenine methylase n=1 Tax=Chryseobacterium sp. StRB126 TaxID=878220 RepID=UPI0004E99AB2|nr:DNA adenine methylase [Chryseobacterium sp. StRB126]BAP30493.1 uncharacterized protein CHSO_1456 [Chryseobacterium sp. StRB126]